MKLPTVSKKAASFYFFQELVSVIISPPITPNKFWGFNKRNSQENYTTLAYPY